MTQYLKKNYKKVIVTNQYVLAKGNIPIALCAHLDTVGQLPPVDIFYDKEYEVMWSPQLLGADDRAGVFAIVNLIEQGYRPSVIFTTDEEIGALGAQALVKRYPKCPFGKIKTIIQLDRRGEDDSVYYSCDNPDFENYINKYGFKTAIGSFSDISILAPMWDIPAVNLSVGYYNEHMAIEHLSLEQLERTIERVGQLLAEANEMPVFEYVEKIVPLTQYSYMRPKPGQCEFCLEPYGKRYYKAYGMKLCKNCYQTCYQY